MTTASRNYLHGRGITDAAITKYGIDGTDDKIIIPIDGFNKYRTFPEKRYFYDKGFKAALFGIKQLTDKWCVLTEGELDALRLASENIPAVSGTGGAGTFKEDWIRFLPPLVFICYDTDQPGKENALKIHHLIHGSRIVHLPDEYKDVSEYLKEHSAQDFETLLRSAEVIPRPALTFAVKVRRAIKENKGNSDIERARAYPIENLLKFNSQRKAKCIWHDEKTPSLHLFPDNFVHCFGCDVHTDAIGVYRQLHGCSFKEAVQKLST